MIHNLAVTGRHGAAGLQCDSKFPNPLQAGPDGLGAGMTVTVAAEEPAAAGDQAHHLAQFGRRFGRWAAVSHDPGGLPFPGVARFLSMTE